MFFTDDMSTDPSALVKSSICCNQNHIYKQTISKDIKAKTKEM